MISTGISSIQGSAHQLNQDSCAAYPDLKVWIVADGMAGEGGNEESAATAASLACASVVQFFQGARFRQVQAGQDPGQEEAASEAAIDLSLALEHAHEFLLDLEEVQQDHGCGAAVVALRLLDKGEEGAWGEVAWAGDARAYAWDGETLWQLTQDHTLQEDGQAQGHILTQAIGVAPQEELEVGQLEGPLPERGVFLLCSDGLSDALSAEEIAAVLSQPHAASLLASQLTQAALRAGSPDDITAVVVKLEDFKVE